MKIYLRSYAEGDENSIAELLHNNFPNALPSDSIRETWMWQFKKEGSRNSGVAVAELNGQIVAQYAVMGFPMNCQGQQIDGAISTATVTDEAVRGQGLFTKLAGKVYADTEKDGCKLIFGFPNSQSIQGFIRKLDWFEIGPFPLHLKLVNSSPFFERVIGINPLSGATAWFCNAAMRLFFLRDTQVKKDNSLEIRHIQEIPGNIDQLWKEGFIKDRIAIVRDKQYLEWRYLRKPFFKYKIYAAFDSSGELVGQFVTYTSEKFGLKIIYVMEMMAARDSRDVYRKMLSQLDELAKELAVDAISLLVMRNNPNYFFFVKNGFLPVPSRFHPQDIYFAARINSEDIDSVFVKNHANWYISWGDLDVV